MSVDSQKYAIKVIRAAFDYLVCVRYLAGNPWQAVSDPLTTQRIKPIRVVRALPSLLWEVLVKILGPRGEVAGNHQDRHLRPMSAHGNVRPVMVLSTGQWLIASLAAAMEAVKHLPPP